MRIFKIMMKVTVKFLVPSALAEMTQNPVPVRVKTYSENGVY